MSFKKAVLISTVLCLAASVFAQGNDGKTEVTVKGKKISIVYGKPPLGSHSVSELPTGGVWRAGMNEATRFQTTGDLDINGKTLAAGTYTIWVKRVSDANWVLAFHPKIQGANGKNLWGAPPLTEGFIAELPLKMSTTKESADPLAITLSEAKGKAAINIHWGTAALSGTFGVK